MASVRTLKRTLGTLNPALSLPPPGALIERINDPDPPCQEVLEFRAFGDNMQNDDAGGHQSQLF